MFVCVDVNGTCSSTCLLSMNLSGFKVFLSVVFGNEWMPNRKIYLLLLMTGNEWRVESTGPGDSLSTTVSTNNQVNPCLKARKMCAKKIPKYFAQKKSGPKNKAFSMDKG